MRKDLFRIPGRKLENCNEKETKVPPGMKQKINIDIDRIIALRNEGKTNREIGELFGCSEGTIRNRLKEKG